MKVIDDESKKFSLGESSQGSIEMRFALYNKETGRTITPFCRCKDYFNDAFWAKYVGKDVIGQYGFSFSKNGDDGLFDKDEISLVIRMMPREKYDKEGKNLNDLNQENLDNILSLLNKFEEPNGFNKSYGEICEEGKHFIITFDKKWTEIPYLVSALFLLLRLGYYYDCKSSVKEFYTEGNRFISPHDQMYLKGSIHIIEDLEKGIIDRNQKYSDYDTQGSIHNNSGIVGYKSKYKGKPAEVQLETV